MRVAVSACLVGKNTKYNGKNNYNQKIVEFLKDKPFILICPEVAGGLPIPRNPSERYHQKVITKDHQDVTNAFIEGAKKELEKVIAFQADLLILKQNSPSCGSKQIYDGTFQNHLITGRGVFCELAMQHGFKIVSENDFN